MIAHHSRRLLPTEPVAVQSSPPPSQRLDRRAARVGFGQGLLVGAVAAAGWFWMVEAQPGPMQPNIAWSGIVVAWAWALLGAGLGRLIVAVPMVRRALGDDGLARASFVVPAVGLAVMAPISLQAVIGALPVLLGANFDAWAVFAVMGTVHVHIAFAIAMGAMAWRLSLGHPTATAALWPAVLLSLMPGGLIVFPPLLVWFTGVAVSRTFATRARQWFLDDERA